MALNPGAARHVCRFDGCDFKVDPQPRAHAVWAMHMAEAHGHRFAYPFCSADCGGRAKPAEGRYVEPWAVKS